MGFCSSLEWQCTETNSLSKVIIALQLCLTPNSFMVSKLMGNSYYDYGLLRIGEVH